MLVDLTDSSFQVSIHDASGFSLPSHLFIVVVVHRHVYQKSHHKSSLPHYCALSSLFSLRRSPADDAHQAILDAAPSLALSALLLLLLAPSAAALLGSLWRRPARRPKAVIVAILGAASAHRSSPRHALQAHSAADVRQRALRAGLDIHLRLCKFLQRREFLCAIGETVRRLVWRETVAPWVHSRGVRRRRGQWRRGSVHVAGVRGSHLLGERIVLLAMQWGFGGSLANFWGFPWVFQVFGCEEMGRVGLGWVCVVWAPGGWGWMV